MKETSLGMVDSNLNVISNVKDVEDAKTCLYSMKFKSQLRKYPLRQLNRSSRTAVSKDQRTGWPIMQMSYLVNDWKY